MKTNEELARETAEKIGEMINMPKTMDAEYAALILTALAAATEQAEKEIELYKAAAEALIPVVPDSMRIVGPFIGAMNYIEVLERERDALRVSTEQQAKEIERLKKEIGLLNGSALSVKQYQDAVESQWQDERSRLRHHVSDLEKRLVKAITNAEENDALRAEVCRLKSMLENTVEALRVRKLRTDLVEQCQELLGDDLAASDNTIAQLRARVAELEADKARLEQSLVNAITQRDNSHDYCKLMEKRIETVAQERQMAHNRAEELEARITELEQNGAIAPGDFGVNDWAELKTRVRELEKENKRLDAAIQEGTQ